MSIINLNSKHSAITNELAVKPLPLIDSPRLVHELAVTRSLPINPVAQIVVTVGVYESAVAIVDVVFELSLIYNVVYLLANTCNLAGGV